MKFYLYDRMLDKLWNFLAREHSVGCQGLVPSPQPCDISMLMVKRAEKGET